MNIPPEVVEKEITDLIVYSNLLTVKKSEKSPSHDQVSNWPVVSFFHYVL